MSKRLMLLLCVSVPSFMINLDANIVAVSLTSIARSLHADFAAIEWVISAYTLTFATLVMPAGALADRFGRKRMLVVGLTVFTVASFFCGAATSTTALNLARAFQGVGAALQLSSALAVLAHGFQGLERAKAFSFWGSVIGVAIMLGPIAGGFITQLLGWEWAFYVNLPIGVAMIGSTLIGVSESKDPQANKIDLAGVITFSGFLGVLTLALISGNRQGWSSRPVTVEFFVVFIFFVVFLYVEMKQVRPMIDLRYFIKPTFLGANIAAVSFAVAFLTMLTFLPFFFQSALGYDPLKAGILMFPLALPLFVVPRIVSNRFEHWMSGRSLLVVGLLLVGAGLAITSMTIGRFSYLEIVVPMFIASTGAGILNGQVAKVGMTVIPVERAGMASGLSGTMRFSGIVVGFSALGAVLFYRVSASVLARFPNVSVDSRMAITHYIANGNVQAAALQMQPYGGGLSVARQSLAYGYLGLLLVAAVVALLSAAFCWWLIDPRETAPHGMAPTGESIAVSVD
jgi:EmrB/QacA subfamily drug resistance transporter